MKQSTGRIIVTLALLFVTTLVIAQVKINPKVGVNISALDAKLMDIDAEARVGWNAGLDLRIGQGLLYIAPGAHYYSFTANLRQQVNDPNDFKIEDETTIQQVKLPVNIGLCLGTGGLGVHVKGGIVPSYIIGVKEKAAFDLTKDDLNAFGLGANVGVGLDLLLFTFEANYELGLSDFFKDASGKNNVLTLSAGIKF